MSRRTEQKPESILILCVDRDNDVGKKTGIKTPILGRKRNMNAAIKLILMDPEESDANAMFEAIRTYDNLEKVGESGETYQIATIAGSEFGGVRADRNLVSELRETLKIFPATSVILVTDGFSDEDVIPLVQSRVPVTSVRRIVVKHSESIEETAAVFSRYFRMLIDDPRYSKIALGLPGVLLITLGILSIIGIFIPYDITAWAWIIGLIIIGASLLGKGYGLDKKLSGFYKWLIHYPYSLSGLTRGFSLISGSLVIGIGLYKAWSYVAANIIPYPLPIDLGRWLEILPQIISVFISESLTMLIIGVCIIFSGRTISYFFDHDSRFWRTIVITLVCAWSWKIFNETAWILLDPTLPMDGLIAAIIIGIFIIIISSLSTHFLSRKYRAFFKRRGIEEKLEEERE